MAQSRFWRAWRVFWLFVREFIGWAFVLISLYVFAICLRYLNQAFVIEGAVAAIVGVMLFRGGLQLVKVAVAARAVRRSFPVAIPSATPTPSSADSTTNSKLAGRLAAKVR